MVHLPKECSRGEKGGAWVGGRCSEFLGSNTVVTNNTIPVRQFGRISFDFKNKYKQQFDQKLAYTLTGGKNLFV